MWILDLSWSSPALGEEESDPSAAAASASGLTPIARIRAKRRITNRSVSLEVAMEGEEEEITEGKSAAWSLLFSTTRWFQARRQKIPPFFFSPL